MPKTTKVINLEEGGEKHQQMRTWAEVARPTENEVSIMKMMILFWMLFVVRIQDERGTSWEEERDECRDKMKDDSGRELGDGRENGVLFTSPVQKEGQSNSME